MGGSRTTEPSLAVWFQVGPWFADIRVPRLTRHPPRARKLDELDRAQAFSGRLVRDGCLVRFLHDLDTLARSSTDEASLQQHGDHLEESGDGYVEHWRRVTDATLAGVDGVVGVAERSAAADAGQPSTVVARVLQVGDLAAAVWSLPAPGGSLLQRPAARSGRSSDGPWRTVATAGDPAGAAGTEEALRLLRQAVRDHRRRADSR